MSRQRQSRARRALKGLKLAVRTMSIDLLRLVARNGIGTWFHTAIRLDSFFNERFSDISVPASFVLGKLHCDHIVALPPITRGTRGTITSEERYVIASLVAGLEPRTLVEVGTGEGLTTLTMALNAPNDATVFTIDLPSGAASNLMWPHTDAEIIESRRVGLCFEDSRHASRIRQILGDTAGMDWSPIPDSIDFAFIDGSHSYEYAKNDTERVLERLAADGVVVWHDYGPTPGGHYGVTAYLDELRSQGHQILWMFGTLLAVRLPPHIPITPAEIQSAKG